MISKRRPKGTCSATRVRLVAKGSLEEKGSEAVATVVLLPSNQLCSEYGGHFIHSGNRMGLTIWGGFLVQPYCSSTLQVECW